MCGSGVIRTSPLRSSIAVVQARPLRAVHVHRAGAANALAAGAAEGQRRVDLVLDLDQRVEDHRPAVVEIDLERVVARILAAVGIVAVDLEALRPLAALGGVRAPCPCLILLFFGRVNSATRRLPLECEVVKPPPRNSRARQRQSDGLGGLQHFGGVARDLHLAPRLRRPARPCRSGRSRAPSPYICGRTSTFRPRCRRRRQIAPSSSEASGTLSVIFVDELLVLLHRVARHADDLGAGLGEVAGERGEVLRFAGAARRVVLGVEIEHQRRARRGEVDARSVAGGDRQFAEPCRLRRSCSLSLDPLPRAPRSFAAPRRCAASSASQSG